MDIRVAKLEAILPTLATKTDIAETRTAVAESKSDIVKWLAGLLFAATALILTVMTFVLGRALPVPRQPLPQQPIVIQFPAQTGSPTLPAPPPAKK